MKKLAILFASIIILAGCATKKQAPYDYSLFKQYQPKSILMVLPDNHSVDTKAEASILARATYPLAEKGYYVFPVTVVDEVFKQNGITDGNLIQQVSLKKIHDIFGADSVFYVKINEYGTSYKVFDSVTTVALEGKLVDVKSGKVIWEGTGSSSEGSTNQNDGALFAMIKAAVNQIIDTNKDKGYQVASPAMWHLVYLGKNGGLLNGARHPLYNQQNSSQP